MLTNRNFSEHKLKRSLYDSLRKQRQLSNRINVLLQEKEKKLKVIERRITLTHQEQENRIEKNLKRQEIEQSFDSGKQSQLKNMSMFREMRQELNSSIHFKQSELKQTRTQWYNQMKKLQEINHKAISSRKEKQLESNRRRHQQIKLSQINSRQNVKRYWDERVDFIHESKLKDEEIKSKMFEDSQANISVLEQKQKQLIEEIRNTAQYGQKLKSEPYEVAFIDQKPLITWRVSKIEN